MPNLMIQVEVILTEQEQKAIAYAHDAPGLRALKPGRFPTRRECEAEVAGAVRARLTDIVTFAKGQS